MVKLDIFDHGGNEDRLAGELWNKYMWPPVGEFTLGGQAEVKRKHGNVSYGVPSVILFKAGNMLELRNERNMRGSTWNKLNPTKYRVNDRSVDTLKQALDEELFGSGLREQRFLKPDSTAAKEFKKETSHRIKVSPSRSMVVKVGKISVNFSGSRDPIQARSNVVYTLRWIQKKSPKWWKYIETHLREIKHGLQTWTDSVSATFEFSDDDVLRDWKELWPWFPSVIVHETAHIERYRSGLRIGSNWTSSQEENKATAVQIEFLEEVGPGRIDLEHMRSSRGDHNDMNQDGVHDNEDALIVKRLRALGLNPDDYTPEEGRSLPAKALDKSWNP